MPLVILMLLKVDNTHTHTHTHAHSHTQTHTCEPKQFQETRHMPSLIIQIYHLYFNKFLSWLSMHPYYLCSYVTDLSCLLLKQAKQCSDLDELNSLSSLIHLNPKIHFVFEIASYWNC